LGLCIYIFLIYIFSFALVFGSPLNVAKIPKIKDKNHIFSIRHAKKNFLVQKTI